MPKVFDQFNPPPYEGAVMGGPILVEPEGYIPAEKQIANMLLAGERLIAGRREAFDFGPDEDVPDDIDIRTRRPGYDLADGTQDLLLVAQRLKEQEEEASKKIKDKKNNEEPADKEKAPVKED